MSGKRAARRGDAFLILLRFALLLVVAAFLAVIARTLWNALMG